MKVVLASHNQHKVAEFQQILSNRIPGLEVVSYDGPEPVEDGDSFAANALIKARAAAAHTGLIALADDSGLAVDIMGGSPGIFSARWAGLSRSDEANRRLLLEQLADVPAVNRGARFLCTIAIVVPPSAAGEAVEHVVSGAWPGTLAAAEAGEGGFGYDPVFVPSELPDGVAAGSTAAQLSPQQKNGISHRARAFGELVPVLQSLADSGR